MPDTEDLGLLDRQFLFARLLPRLIDKAHELGFTVTLGECWRSSATARLMAEQGRGIALSLHTDRLAVDLNLFTARFYHTDRDAHAPLGEFWCSLHPLCRWGGNWHNRPDPNHYSITFGSRE